MGVSRCFAQRANASSLLDLALNGHFASKWSFDTSAWLDGDYPAGGVMRSRCEPMRS